MNKMIKIAFLLNFFLIALIPFSGNSSNKINLKVKTEIQEVLSKQIRAWNEGSLENFMETYLKSEKLIFVGSRGPTYGWQSALDNYKTDYPTKERMGKLEFEILNISKIDSKAVFVVGKFFLTRNTDNQKGFFTLVIQKIKGEWLITSDHSSSIK